MENKVVLLLSGGIDSVVLLYWLIENKYKVYPLHINYGQTTNESEIKAIKQILSKELLSHTFFMDVPSLITMGSGTLTGEYPKQVGSREAWHEKEFFPNRNLILLTLASSYSSNIDINKISIGVVGRNSYSDTKNSFLKSAQKTLSLSLNPIEIIAPFAGRSRKEVIRSAIDFNVPIELTFSCNSHSGNHCLFCNSCLERQQALDLMGKHNQM